MMIFGYANDGLKYMQWRLTTKGPRKRVRDCKKHAARGTLRGIFDGKSQRPCRVWSETEVLQESWCLKEKVQVARTSPSESHRREMFKC